jgi:hypothetical protein
MMRDRKISSMFAVLLAGAVLLSACGKINLPTLLVMDPAATNTLTISLPASFGGGSVVSTLVGNVDTTVIVDTNNLLSAKGVPATVVVNSFSVAGTSINLGSIPSGTLCTYIPAGESAGGIAYLRPLIFKDATFSLTIPTETISVSEIVRAMIPPIPLTITVDAKAKIDLMGLINLMLKGTGLSINQNVTMTIPSTIPLLGGSSVKLEAVLKSTKTKVTDPLLDACTAVLATL